MALKTGSGTPAQKRLARKARMAASEAATNQEADSTFASNDVGDDEAEQEGVPNGTGRGEIDDESEQPQARTLTAAERKEQQEEAEGLHHEEAEKRRKRIAKLKRGIEGVAKLHNCNNNWEEMLLSASKILEERSDYNAKSEKGRRLFRRIEYLKNEFQHDQDPDPEADRSQPVCLVTQIENLKQCMDTLKDLEADDQKRDLSRRGKDLNQLVVPGLVFLLRAAFRARKAGDDFDINAYEEISPLLTLSYKAANVACDWEPRPSGLEGVKSLVRNIRKNLGEVSERYAQELHRLQWPIEEKRRLDALEEKQKLDQQRLNDDIKRRRDRIFRERQEARDEYARNHARNRGVQGTQSTQVIQAQSSRDREMHTTRIPPSSQNLVMRTKAIDEAQVRRARIFREKELEGRGVPAPSRVRAKEPFDIDNLDNFDVEDGNPAQAAPRPTPRRQQTEEIPGPVSNEWSAKQLEVLINSLQVHTKEDRFQEIFQRCGDQLGDRSLDDIVSQSKFVKASMAARLESELDATWDWLRSVPSA